MAARTNQKESITHPFTNLEVGGVLGGFAVGVVGFVDFSRAGSRVRNAVEEKYPRQYQLDDLRKADQDIRAFDRLNGEAIRQGGLIISVPPEVAARLQVAYSMQDKELDRLKNQSTLSTELYQQEQTFDPVNLHVGRSVIDISVCGLGMAMMIAGTISMLRRARNNPT